MAKILTRRARAFERRENLLPVVRCFLGDEDVVHVTLTHSGVTDFDEARAAAKLVKIRGADIAHPGLQAADQLLDIRGERAAMRHPSLDSFRNMFAVGINLPVAIAGALVHRAYRTHPAIKLVGASLVENRLAGTFLGARE